MSDYLTDPNYGAEDPLFPSVVRCSRCGLHDGQMKDGNRVEQYEGLHPICLDCSNTEDQISALPWNS